MSKLKLWVAFKELSSRYYELGSAQKVAEFYGVSKKTVLRHMETLGIPRNSLTKVTPEVLEEIRLEAIRGTKCSMAAERIGLDPSTLRVHAASLGLRFVDSYHSGYITTWNGYLKVKQPEHPAADRRGYVMEQVLVAEAKIGRFLTLEECVHHKDGNKKNNTPENVEVMLLKEHASLHAKAGDTGWAKYHENRKI